MALYNRKNVAVAGLFFLCWPVGLVKVWKRPGGSWWFKLLYTLLGFPLFAIIYGYLAVLATAAFLPPIDRSMGHPANRTIVNTTDHYAVTFLKTGQETGGNYEEVQVKLAPGGGNDWHYHTAFVEKFHVINGTLTIGMEDTAVQVTAGQDTIAPKRLLHKFSNATQDSVTFLVRMEPARSFEKTIRAAYGLMQTGQASPDGLPNDPWHLFLILGYSDSYLPFLPSLIQEPLIDALGKIAQWKGKDRDLQPFFH